MNPVVLTNISLKIDTNTLLERLHIESESEDGKKLKLYVSEALKIGRPKALYYPSFVEAREQSFVIIDGIRFDSSILSINLENVYRVFPFVVSCGMELHEWSASISDIVERYWTDTICEIALDSARKALNEDIKERFQIHKASRMNPGSLKDWPISEQKQLFRLLGNTEESVGVTLTSSYLMIPFKSVSGILFPTEESFESCQLCPRENCPRRRAPYDKALLNEKYKA